MFFLKFTPISLLSHFWPNIEIVAALLRFLCFCSKVNFIHMMTVGHKCWSGSWDTHTDFLKKMRLFKSFLLAVWGKNKYRSKLPSLPWARALVNNKLQAILPGFAQKFALQPRSRLLNSHATAVSIVFNDSCELWKEWNYTKYESKRFFSVNTNHVNHYSMYKSVHVIVNNSACGQIKKDYPVWFIGWIQKSRQWRDQMQTSPEDPPANFSLYFHSLCRLFASIPGPVSDLYSETKVWSSCKTKTSR